MRQSAAMDLLLETMASLLACFVDLIGRGGGPILVPAPASIWGTD